VPVAIGGDNLPSPVGIGLTDLSNIGGPPGSGITAVSFSEKTRQEKLKASVEGYQRRPYVSAPFSSFYIFNFSSQNFIREEDGSGILKKCPEEFLAQIKSSRFSEYP
jgi:hypothetical protein